MSRDALTPEEARHLLRRVGFAATPSGVAATAGRSADSAFSTLLEATRIDTSLSGPVPWEDYSWRNGALRYVGMSQAEFDAASALEARRILADRETAQRWWLERLVHGQPLREHMALFLQSFLGSGSVAVGSGHALVMHAQMLRRMALSSYGALLQTLVLDPASMIQIGMDDHGAERVSDRPAKIILDRWTVGPGNYSSEDLEELSRALTGWRLEAPDRWQPEREIDSRAPLAARRTGHMPRFSAERHDDGDKTLLGVNGKLDAALAMAVLAAHPLTAQRFVTSLLTELGVVEPPPSLTEHMQQLYLDTGGEIPALLRAAVLSDAFWSPETRWSRIKSPVQLAVGACQQLEIERPPLAAFSAWLNKTGQPLFDTLDNGESPWPQQAEWLEPADRLAQRYQLANVLAAARLPAGLKPAQCLERLDPAPGPAPHAASVSQLIARILSSAHYQLA